MLVELKRAAVGALVLAVVGLASHLVGLLSHRLGLFTPAPPLLAGAASVMIVIASAGICWWAGTIISLLHGDV